ncbi:GntR family transcriptional regulator [Anaerorhabdus sp.]|mgnify:CR=1 FL=1|nr:GntR family transcriptional regulator [Anaerorhabdus sp.]MEA4874703.1 GntR family transcriptional regulator [Anaerorhabdus sp.]
MGIPIYQQIMDIIRDEIKDQEPNTPILSERELEKKYNASRMTVRKAIDLLVEEGYLYREQNIGTFVADSKLHKKSTQKKVLDSFNTNLDYKIIYFDVKDENREVAQKLEISTHDQYVRIVRLNLKEGHPQSLDQIYIVRIMIDDSVMHNILNILEFSAKVETGSVNQVFKPMIVPVKFANLMNVKINTPIICVESKVNTKNGRVYAYIESYLNPNEKSIELTL